MGCLNQKAQKYSQAPQKYLMKSEELVELHDAAQIEFQGNRNLFSAHYTIKRKNNDFLQVHGRKTQVYQTAIRSLIPSGEKEMRKIYIHAYQLTKLSHPNLVKTNQFYEENEYSYLLQDMCQGDPVIRHVTKLTSYNEYDVQQTMYTLLSTLYYLHKNNVYHGSLHPGNLIYQSKTNKNLKIINYGVITRSAQYNDFEVMKHKIYTKKRFFSFDPIKEDQSFAEDIWSCGILIYYLIIGSFPQFEYNTVNKQEELCSKDTSLSIDVFDLIKKMLNKDGLQRPNASQCLKHQWFKKYNNAETKKKIETQPIRQQSIQNMKTDQISSIILDLSILYFTSTFKNYYSTLKTLFKSIDTDQSGFLTQEKMTNVITINKKKLKDQQEILLQELLQEEDPIDYNQFIIKVMNFDTIINQEKIEALFLLIDVDNVGKVSLSEVKNYISDVNSGSIDINFDNMMASMDVNKDGMVSQDEFIECFLKKFQ